MELPPTPRRTPAVCEVPMTFRRGAFRIGAFHDGAFRRASRVVAVVGVVVASSFAGTAGLANHAIIFTDCPTSAPAPSPTAPGLTPPPNDPPAGEQTPLAEPTPTPPPQNCMPPAGDRIFGSRTIQFTIDDNNDRLRSVRLSILSEEQNIPSANQGNPVASWTPGNEERTFSYQWNSLEATPYNGSYKVVVAADASRPLATQQHATSAERNSLRVDNPPQTVSAPTILAKTFASVTLEWPAAPELDVTAYTIYRATTKDGSTVPPYSALAQVGVTTGPAFRDSAVQPGYHWYAIKVTRRSIVTPDTGISSPISAISAPAEVKSLKEIEKKADEGKKPAPRRFVPFRQLAPARPVSRLSAVADAPFKYKLPYDSDQALDDVPLEEPAEQGATDPRGPVLPVAVGMFLVSSALAVGRMPY